MYWAAAASRGCVPAHTSKRRLTLSRPASARDISIRPSSPSRPPQRHSSSSSGKPEEGTYIEVAEPVSGGFGLRYLNSFGKAAPLSGSVQLSLSPDMPMCVSFQIEDIGYVKYYLAPKMEEDEEDMGGGSGGGAEADMDG
jgi:hypothetical protein